MPCQCSSFPFLISLSHYAPFRTFSAEFVPSICIIYLSVYQKKKCWMSKKHFFVCAPKVVYMTLKIKASTRYSDNNLYLSYNQYREDLTLPVGVLLFIIVCKYDFSFVSSQNLISLVIS